MKVELKHEVEYDGEWWKIYINGVFKRVFMHREDAEKFFTSVVDGRYKETIEVVREVEL